MNKKNNRKGFTIVELVIVIAVIAILATVLIPTFGNMIQKANNSKLLQQLKNEYTEYTITVPAASIEEDIVIKVGNNYYAIDNGAPVAVDGTVTALTGDDIPGAGESYWNADETDLSKAWVTNPAN